MKKKLFLCVLFVLGLGAGLSFANAEQGITFTVDFPGMFERLGLNIGGFDMEGTKVSIMTAFEISIFSAEPDSDSEDFLLQLLSLFDVFKFCLGGTIYFPM